MGEFDLNLSTRPFPAYRATNLMLLVILILLAIISVWQVYGFFQYSSLAGEIRSQQEELLVESQALTMRLNDAESRLDRPEATAKLSEIEFLNGLITRKNFSWTKIFASLESLFPDNVHLLDLTPEFAADGSVILQFNVRARSIDDVASLIDLMEESVAFENVKVSREIKAENDVDVGLSASYFPEKVQP